MVLRNFGVSSRDSLFRCAVHASWQSRTVKLSFLFPRLREGPEAVEESHFPRCRGTGTSVLLVAGRLFTVLSAHSAAACERQTAVHQSRVAAPRLRAACPLPRRGPPEPLFESTAAGPGFGDASSHMQILGQSSKCKKSCTQNGGSNKSLDLVDEVS